MRVQPKEFLFLDTKTRWSFEGTHNGYCPESLGELLPQELEEYESYLQANKGNDKQFMGKDSPPLMVQKLNHRLSESKDLDMEDQDLEFIRYYTSLQYCNTVEVSDSDYERIKVVLDDFEEDGGIKCIMSTHAHLLELIQGRSSSLARIKWFKVMKKHMTYSHYYCLSEVQGMEFLDIKTKVEMVDKSLLPYKKTSLLRVL